MIGLLEPELHELVRLGNESRSQAPRSMRQFAEEEIVLPDGPFAGRRFRCARQPHTAMFFDAVDSGRFNRIFSTGPVQSGKTLLCYVIPMLYHLFERRQTVVVGVPDQNMSNDKWKSDFLPVIEKTRYNALLPETGAGSRGGKILRIDFRNGATLRFMAPGATDKGISGFTAPVAGATEIDGWATITRSRKVADPITEVENRTGAYGDRKRFYAECTLTDKHGRTFKEISGGTGSQILLPCPHCGAWVVPERDNLTGWADARTEEEAQEKGAFACPACGHPWTEHERRAACREGRLVHQGQHVDESGQVQGPAPETKTLGFRYSAVHNLLLSSGEIAAKVWRLENVTEDGESGERQICQNIFAIPYEPAVLDISQRDVHRLIVADTRLGRGVIPLWTQMVAVGIDWHGEIKGKIWGVFALGAGRRMHLVDYGRCLNVNEIEEKILRRDWVTGDGVVFRALGGVDSRYDTPTVYDWVRGFYPQVVPTKGEQSLPGRTIADLNVDYTDPRTGRRHFGLVAMRISTLYYKDLLAALVLNDEEMPFTLFNGAGGDYIQSLKSEHKVAKGGKEFWEKRPSGGPNHFLDVTVIAMAVGDRMGWGRMAPLEPAAARPQEAVSPSDPPPANPRFTDHLAMRRH